MNVRELKERLNEFPDDMEVFTYEEMSGYLPIIKPEEIDIVEEEVEDHRFSGKTYRVFNPPSNYSRKIIRKFRAVLIDYY